MVGTWSAPEDGAKWLASGATRALAKPVSPHELRKAVFQLSSGGAEPMHHIPLGQTTVEELTARILEGNVHDRLARRAEGDPPAGGWICRLCDQVRCGRPLGICPAARATS